MGGEVAAGAEAYVGRQINTTPTDTLPRDDKLDIPVAFLALCPYFIVNPLSEHVHLSYLAVIFRHHNILLPDCYSRIQFLINFHILQFSRSLWASIIAYSILITVLQTLTLNAPIAKKVVCFFSSAEIFKKPLWQTVWTQIRLLL